jgi:hypothetical protein
MSADAGAVATEHRRVNLVAWAAAIEHPLGHIAMRGRALLLALGLALGGMAWAPPASSQMVPCGFVDRRYVASPTALRLTPNVNGRRAAQLARGVAVAVLEQPGTWAMVRLVEEQTLGWVSLRALALNPPRHTDAEIRRLLVRASIDAYDGNCPCAYFTDSIGRSCGGRSAWSRAGGESPWCYPRDVPQEAIDA